MTDMHDVKQVLGMAQDIVFKVGDAVARAGGDSYWGLRHLTTPEGQKTLARIGAVIADANARSGRIKEVPVERRITLKEAIERCHFDEVDPLVEFLFTLPESPDIVREVVPISILGFGYDIEVWGGLEKMVAQLKRRHYRPATLGEGLALAETKEHNLGVTFFLGSTADGPDGVTPMVCYLDECLNDWDQGKQCRTGTKCLRVIEADDRLVRRIDEISKRNKDNSSERSWVLAVRE